MVVWWGTPLECAAALARMGRERRLETAEENQAHAVWRALAAHWIEVLPSAPVRDTALRMVRVHPLRSADALQLAACWVWSDGSPTGHELVTLDTRLREAAEREGFSTLPV